MRNEPGKIRGYALFDALLGSFILALALLVAAYSGQLGQQASNYAWYGQQALIIAEDMADRIRINANIDTSYGQDYVSSRLWQSTSPVCQNCSAAQQMRQDGYEINRMLSRLLPAGGASVKQCGESLCIYVWWHDDPPNGNACSEHCIRLIIQP